jgi:3'(2'), 5'-bisphosphate nucleotidase
MQKELESAIKAALKAGEAILEIYDKEDFGIELKSDNTPLTRADLASHAIIMNELKDSSIPVLSEEGRSIPYEERKNWSKLWIVDPIDGTKEFIKRNGEFTVNIALIEDNTPTLGVIYVPVTGELFFASSNTGTKKTNAVDSKSTVQSVLTNSIDLPFKKLNQEYTVVASRSHMNSETESYIAALNLKHGKVNTISKGSSLKLCLVAEGAADCYPRFAPTMEWDIAAGHAIFKYAGFNVIDQKTMKEMVYNREELLNNWFIVQ